MILPIISISISFHRIVSYRKVFFSYFSFPTFYFVSRHSRYLFLFCDVLSVGAYDTFYFSCLFMSFHVFSCLFMSFHVVSCLFMSFHVISCLFMSLHVFSCLFVFFHVFYVFSCVDVSFMFFHVILFFSWPPFNFMAFFSFMSSHVVTQDAWHFSRNKSGIFLSAIFKPGINWSAITHPTHHTYHIIMKIENDLHQHSSTIIQLLASDSLVAHWRGCELLH